MFRSSPHVSQLYKMLMDKMYKVAFPPLIICDESLPTADGMPLYNLSHEELFNRRNKKMSKIKDEKLEFKKGDKVMVVNELERDFITVYHAYIDDYEDDYYDENDKCINYTRKIANVVLSDGKVYRQSSIIHYSQPIINLARSNKQIENRLEELEKENERGFFARLFKKKKKKKTKNLPGMVQFYYGNK